MAKRVMLVGTASNVGKSVLATAVCRMLRQDGYSVAPFKAQNMSLNSAVTPSGCEIGRAQAVQAEACGLLPNEHMNPVLLKPTGEMTSQIVLQGRVLGTKSARDYFFDSKDDIWNAVVESYNHLAARYDVVVIEGAGSPVEMNLKKRDISNMRTAEMADAPVILVADIDRGGVFASVVGTLQLLDPDERARVKGIIINRFRGDVSLFDDGRLWLEAHTGVPVIGVIPFIPDLGIDEEDSVGLASDRYQSRVAPDPTKIRIGIVQVPHISNFTDFDPLFLEADVQAYFCTKPTDLLDADVIVIPGTKSTLLDLTWLHEHGWVDVIRQGVTLGWHVLGICGGYQILGQQVRDPNHLESSLEEYRGLELFPVTTTIGTSKRTVLVNGVLAGRFEGIPVQGYEIHMGITEFLKEVLPFARVSKENSGGSSDEGVISADGHIIGTYLHGILHNDVFRTSWLNQVRVGKGLSLRSVESQMSEVRASEYHRLARIVREHMNMPLLYDILANPVPVDKA